MLRRGLRKKIDECDANIMDDLKANILATDSEICELENELTDILGKGPFLEQDL